MKTGYDDYRGQSVLWVLTPRSVICFRGALVLAKYSLWVCHLWHKLGGSLVWSEASHQICVSWSLLEGASVQAKVSRCWSLAQGQLVGAAE